VALDLAAAILSDQAVRARRYIGELGVLYAADLDDVDIVPERNRVPFAFGSVSEP
jgi:hypothetical protein